MIYSTKFVDCYTDGACSGNPGNGGWAAILIYKSFEKILTGGEKDTTNNRMELTAVIKGLEALKEPCNVTVYSDSAYVVNAMQNDWIGEWKANGWKNSDNKPVKNLDLWQRLDELLSEHRVRFIKVAGHADVDYNNRCDAFARREIKKLS